MRVLVCGGRDLDPYAGCAWLQVNAMRLLLEIVANFNPHGHLIVVHGGSQGADRAADLWAKTEGYDIAEYKADWKKYGRAAGPIRNAQMLAEGKPDIVIALPGGRGTADMVRQAKAAGVPVIEVDSLG